jgi:hypothetical protein
MADIIILTGGAFFEERSPRIQRHLGAYRIASELKKHGYTVTVIDYLQYMTAEEVVNAISKCLTPETLWVGYSSTFFYYHGKWKTPIEKMYQTNSKEKMDLIHSYVRKNSNAKIVFGGAYAMLSHADPDVDYYVVSYADTSIVDLTNYLAGKKDKLDFFTEKDIEGKKSVVIDSGKYPEPKIDELETYFEDFPLIPGEGVPVEFARGCIFKCKFCQYPLIGKQKGTYIRDMHQIRDELVRLWEVHGTDAYYMTDDTFNDDNDKLEEFHKLFTSLPFKPRFAAFLRLDLIDRYPDQADLLLESGLVANFFGIETFNHKSGKAIGKGVHPDRVKERLKWVRKKWEGKVNTGVGQIIGLPHDDEKYFQELWDFVHSADYPVQHTSFNALHLADQRKGVNFYGSEFSLHPEKYGYKFNDDGHWYNEGSGLNFLQCVDIADKLQRSKFPTDLVPDFSVITFLSMGVPMEEITSIPAWELEMKYNFAKMNNDKLTWYKKQIGAI